MKTTIWVLLILLLANQTISIN